MYLCYVDESGTSSIPGNTSHFILAGISIPIWHWGDCDREIGKIKRKYALDEAEIHTGWIARAYPEQSKISQFESLDYQSRQIAVERSRKTELLRLQRSNKRKQYHQTKKNYKKSKEYTHLSRTQRNDFLEDIAKCVGNWGFARLFAECIDKVHFDERKTQRTVDEQAFEQIVSRFERYLMLIGSGEPDTKRGLLIHDNNQNVEAKHTKLMKQFHKVGTLWTKVNHIIGTPLFVDSGLTDMVQIADLCAYAIRRYLENGEDRLFNLVFPRADRKDGITVGVRHNTVMSPPCDCKICVSHIPGVTPVP